jgi:hypothetical protein
MEPVIERRCVVRVLVAMVALVALLVGPPAMAEVARSGSVVIDLDKYVPGVNGATFNPRGNILDNAGFETGSLPPWYSDDWYVTGADAHSGAYSAECDSNRIVRQDLDPVNVGSVLSISMWSKQPLGVAFQAVRLYYGPDGSDEFLVAPGVDWTFIDMTAEKRATGMLTGIGIWGYEMPEPGFYPTLVDDVFIDHVTSPVESATWGLIKAMYR